MEPDRSGAEAAVTGPRSLIVTEEQAGQRIDNLLLRELKGVPRSRIYSMLRRGEVRVDGSRVRPTHRLQAGQTLRLPPTRGTVGERSARPSRQLTAVLEAAILLENERVIVLDKPAGLAVHGGSGVSLGLVEALRGLRPGPLELVHRLDRDTSGCIVVARKRRILKALHAALREQRGRKRYLAIVDGRWPDALDRIDAPLKRVLAPSGERFVRVDPEGKPALTRVRVIEHLDGATLLELAPETGRTHQLRVHLAQAGHPILGDPKYAGDAARARHGDWGVTRLCLHAAAIAFPDLAEDVPALAEGVEAPMPADMTRVVERLRRGV